MKKLKKWIKCRQALNWTKIEQEAGIPARTLHNWLGVTDRPFPGKHVPRLCAVLCQYGLTIDDYRLSFEDGVFIGVRDVGSATWEEVGNSVEYTQKQDKVLLDNHDLITFIEEE